MFKKFLNNDIKNKSFGKESDDARCTIEFAEKLIHDSDYRIVQSTKLHRKISEIITDRTTLTFFVQFLELKNGISLVKFWLDCEAFKTVQNGHMTSLRLESSVKNHAKLRRSASIDGCDSNDCVSISTTCSESNIDETEEIQTNIDDNLDHSKVATYNALEKMTQSLTDDEKSKICEKSRKECDIVESEEVVKKILPTMLEDALRIYKKFLITGSDYSIELPATTLSKLSLALCETETDENCDSLDIFKAFQDAQNHALEVLEKDYLSEFLESSFYCKYTVDVLTSESLNLREILYSESALFFFMEFLEQEKDNKLLPYLEFWLSATNFRKQTGQSLQHICSDALVIYEKHFSLQASQPLNFSNHIRTRLEESICSNEASIVNCFDLPIQVVETFLDRNCFKKFVKSQLFFKHLSEVMGKIDRSDKANSTLSVKFPTNISHRRTSSDSIPKGIPRSISAQNTLLAGLGPKKNKNTTDLNIDSRQLNDPDLLWRRNNSMNRLSFGRIDSFGRFERDFDLPSGSAAITHSKSLNPFQLHNGSIDLDDPQSLLELNGSQSRFKNVMRKLVHLPEDSIQQEIAWQVAEMIVKDVTNITLSNGDS